MTNRLTLLTAALAATLGGGLPLPASELEMTAEASPETVSPNLTWTPPPPPEKQWLPGGKLDLGGVLIDPETKTIFVPVVLNLRNDFLEYLLVHENGKTHESLLRTPISPTYMHTAMLLIGLPPPDGRGPSDPPPATIDSDWLEGRPAPTGVPVQLSLIVGAPFGENQELPIETWVLDKKAEGPMNREHWVYNSSFFDRNIFAAELYGSVVSLITDHSCLINYTGSSRVDDTNWMSAPEIPEWADEKPLFLKVSFRQAEPSQNQTTETIPTLPSNE